MSMTDDGSSDQGGTRLEADLRVARQEKDQLQSQLQQMLRREAARDAGLDLRNPQHRFFVEKYDGDLNEMAAYAQTLGYLSSQEQIEQQQADASTAALGRVAGIGAGAGGASAAPQSQQNIHLREEADTLMDGIKNRKVEVEQVEAWARKAGVPFVGEE